MTTTQKLKPNTTLIRFYNWVKQWSERVPLSTDDKSSQAVSKKPEQKYHDRCPF